MVDHRRVDFQMDVKSRSIITLALMRRIHSQYVLDWEGIHGVSHWGRVLENGERLATETDADLDVVRLFAVLHDSCRNNDGHDPQHGERAAVFAERLRGTLVELDNTRFALLRVACARHTHGRSHPDITVQTCWDADRLDLMRVGTLPDPRYLCTDAAKRQPTLEWATRRSSDGFVPAIVNQWHD